MPSAEREQERRIRRRGWLQTFAFLGAAAILGAMLYSAVVVQSNRRAAERTATAIMQTLVGTAAPRPPLTAEPLEATVQAVLRSTPLPSDLLPITADSAAQVAEVARWGRGALRAVAWSPDGRVLAIGTTIGVFLVDPQTLQELRFLDTRSEIYGLAFSPDGQTLAAISRRGGGDQPPQAWRWRVADGALVETIPDIPYSDVTMAFPDGGSLLLAWLDWADDSLAHWEGGKAKSQLSVVLVQGRMETRLPIPQGEGGEKVPSWLALSPDGRFLAVGVPDRRMYLYRVDDGVLLATLEGGKPMGPLVFSPNGRVLASASAGAGVRVWQVADGRLLYFLDEPAKVWDLAFSADGRRLAVLGGETAWLYGVDSGALVRVLDVPPHNRDTLYDVGAASSPDGQSLAVGVFDGPLLMFQTEDGRLRRSWSGFGQPLIGLALSADGSTLASGAYPGGDVWLWDAARAVPRQLLRPSKYLSFEPRPLGAFSPDGRFLAQAEVDNVALWRVADGTVVERLPPAAQGVAFQGVDPLCTAFSPDGQWLAVGYRTGSLLLWQTDTGARRWFRFEVKPIEDAIFTVDWCELAFSPDGQYLAAAWFGSPAYLLRVSEGTIVHQWEGQTFGGVAFSPDGRLLAVRQEFAQIYVYEVPGGNLASILYPEISFLGSGWAFSPDGTLLALGLLDGPIQLWRVKDWGERHILSGHADSVTGLAFSADGRLLFSASLDGTIRVWGVR